MMGTTRAPRRPRRARPAYANALAITLNKVHKLSRADVMAQRELMATALREFSAGKHCALHWRSLADTSNMAETMAAMGLCSGADAQQLIHAAQTALAAVAQRHQAGGSWTLYPRELDALAWLNTLHGLQLQECDYGEFSRALTTTHHRIAAARAGNAPAGAVVVEGQID